MIERWCLEHDVALNEDLTCPETVQIEVGGRRFRQPCGSGQRGFRVVRTYEVPISCASSVVYGDVLYTVHNETLQMSRVVDHNPGWVSDDRLNGRTGGGFRRRR